MHSLRLLAGAELSSSWPPGSVVSMLPEGSAAGSGRTAGAVRSATAGNVRLAGTGSAGSRASRTSHSSSTPTLPGGPVLKTMPWTCVAAVSSVRPPSTGGSLGQVTVTPFVEEGGTQTHLKPNVTTGSDKTGAPPGLE